MLLLVWAEKIADVAPFCTWPKQSDYAARWQAGDKTAATELTATKKSLIVHIRRLVGKFVLERVKKRLAWQRHLAEARRGLVR